MSRVPMRLLPLVAVLMAAAPRSVSADVRVMCYGDSITAGTPVFQPETSYPAELQRLRPDLEVINEGLPGDVTENVDRLRGALAFWQPQLVVVMLGINDAVCNPAQVPSCAATATPERSVANLLRMVGEARHAGAQVILLTPPPAVCGASCQAQPALEFATAVRDAFAERVAEELLRARLPAGVRVANLRGAFTRASWQAVSVDGLHPAQEGNRRIAEFVSARIRGPRAASDRPLARRPAPEPDPFARHPPHGHIAGE